MAVIGCGSISHAHMHAVAAVEGLRLVATVDIDASRARACAREFDAPHSYTSIASALKNPRVDAVVVCLPHSLHADACVAASKAGKHVLVEKPIATSLADTDRMIAAAREAGKILMVGQVLRFRNSTKKARALIQKGAIGLPVHVLRRRIMHHVDVPRPWAIDPAVAGGWTLYGFGSHEADWILHVANARPLSTFALARRNNPVWRDYDEITATMQLSNGAIATLVMSLNSLAQRAWDGLIIGTKGSMHVTDERIILNDKTIEAPNDTSHGMIPQMREFASAIRNRRRPRASAEDVRFTMQALEAMRISAQTGRPVDASSL